MLSVDIQDIQQWLDDLLDRGLLPDQSYSEYSKPINFYLGYKSSHGDFLEPLFHQLADEIEKHEGRKNRRSLEVHERFLHAVKILVLNTMQTRRLIGSNLFLAASFNRNEYIQSGRYAVKSLTYKTFKQAFDGLLALEYLEIHRKGFNSKSAYNQSYRTRINATEKLVTLCASFVAGKDISYVRVPAVGSDIDELIILRDKEKKSVDYEESEFTRRSRSNLEFINAVISSRRYELSLSGHERDDLTERLIKSYNDDPEFTQPYIDFEAVRLYRIFSDNSFSRGGRFYRGWWQNVPKAYRPRITIDGQSVIEIDFSAFHPSILYAQQGVALDFDAYDIHPKVSRNLGKVAFNALLNAKGMPRKPSDFHEELTGISWVNYLDLMMEKHSRLTADGKFLNGYGLEVQFMDSELAETILMHFARKDVPCLPIHDSFIVSQEWADELEYIMKHEYENKFGMSVTVKRVQS